MPRQRRPSQYQPWGPKLPQVQNLGGKNCNFEKVRVLKLQLSLKINKYKFSSLGGILHISAKFQGGI